MRRLAIWALIGVLWIAASDLFGADQPGLIVVVSVDQLAYEYLDRFRDNFAEDGFLRRVERTGAWYAQAHHRHAFTLTGPGHAVFLTGTYPYRGGVIGNDWYDRATGKSRYCVEDTAYPIVGAPTDKAELKGVSPQSLLVETLGDVLKRVTGGKSKVFGVTLKDRAAVLMAGRAADGAYWFDANTGAWVTSRYYREQLPDYLAAANAGDLAESWLGSSWNLLLAADRYRLNCPDDNPYEGDLEGLGAAFPHRLTADLPSATESTTTKNYYKQLVGTPFGNDMTLRVAQMIVERERLGQDEHPDLLAIGFSANDYVGHSYGPQSLEVEDITYRTDKLLGQLLDYLDEKIGRGRWVLGLSADHAVSPLPEYAVTIGLPAARNPMGDAKEFLAKLESHLAAKFGPAGDKPYVAKLESQQVFLRAEGEPAVSNAPSEALQDAACEFLRRQPAIVSAITRHEILNSATPPLPLAPEYASFLTPETHLLSMYRKTFHRERSGDVLFTLKPYHIVGSLKATHGSPWRYDTHVPLLLVGAGIVKVRSDRPVSPAALAPTLAGAVRVPAPAQNEEQVLIEALGM